MTTVTREDVACELFVLDYEKLGPMFVGHGRRVWDAMEEPVRDAWRERADALISAFPHLVKTPVICNCSFGPHIEWE